MSLIRSQSKKLIALSIVFTIARDEQAIKNLYPLTMDTI